MITRRCSAWQHAVQHLVESLRARAHRCAEVQSQLHPATTTLLLACFRSSTPQPVAFVSHLPKTERLRHGNGSGALAALASQVPLRLASASQLHLLDSQW